MGAIVQYDYVKMEAQFIRGTMSIRALALEHGMKNPTALHNKAKKKDATGKDWYEKRAAYQARSSTVMINELARDDAVRAAKLAKVRDNALDLFDESITTFRSQLKERTYVAEHDQTGEIVWVERPKHPLHPSTLKELLDRINEIAGRPIVMTAHAGDDDLGFELTGDARDAGTRAAVLDIASAIRARPRVVGPPDGGRAAEDPTGS